MSGSEIEQALGIGTIQLPRFPRIDVRHAERLAVRLSTDYRPHGQTAAEPRGELPPAEPGVADPLLRALDELRVDRQLGRPAPYQHLVLLWAISEAVRGGDRLRAFSSASADLRSLLAPFAVGETAPDPELPWFALRNSPWWSLFPEPDGPVARGGRDFVRAEDPVGGLTREAYQRVREDPVFRESAVQRLTAPLAGQGELDSTIRSLFPSPTTTSSRQALEVLQDLVGRRLATATGSDNRILRVVPPDVLVATDRSPHGQPVPIAEIQRALDLLDRHGEVTIDVATLGHRSSFVGAVLAALDNVTVVGSPPVASLVDTPLVQPALDEEPTERRRTGTERTFGELPGSPVGTTWATRAEVSRAGVHRPNQSGISGTKADGCDSIVVSGGYEDDRDEGDEIYYTGAGGNDPATGRQIADQTLDQFGNAGLVTSQLRGLPVRVVRGARGERAYSPTSGYRYEGLYRVADHWSREGRSGFRVWQFHLIRLTDQEAAPYTPDANVPAGRTKPRTSQGVTTRVVRDTEVSRYVKRLYGDACQVCGERLEVPGGAISEGAHIRAVGRPHLGPDTVDNVLCLCPNHHSLFDAGGIYVGDDMTVYDHRGEVIGPLTRHANHGIDLQHLRSHRSRWGY
jgi:putative restriction endonuclease